jgi:FtsH-binding integral membrane protein
MINKINSINLKYKIFCFLFWASVVELAAGLILLFFYNDSLQNVSVAFAITGMGMTASWICFGMCNTMKKELQFKLFKTEIQTQLERIETKIKK